MARHFCPRCGLPLHDGEAQACARCGLIFAASDPARANFDDESGAPLRSEPVPLRCWHCGETIQRDAFVCPSCATQLTHRGSAAERYDVAATRPGLSALGHEAPPSSPSDVSPPVDEPECRHCGFGLAAAAASCPRCGAVQDPPGQAEGVVVAVGRADAGPERRRGSRFNIIARHWQGDLSLGVSFWVVSFLLSMALYGLVYLVELSPETTPLSLFLWLAGAWVVLLAVSVWQLVGIWRSARRRRRERRSRGRGAFWAITAQIWVGISVLALVQSVVVEGRLQVREGYRIAFLGDPDIPDFTVVIDPGTRAIVFTGGVKFGVAEAIEEALRRAPETVRVVLNSPGGRIGPAVQAGDVIREHGLSTRVDRRCLSACTLIFAAGDERTLGPMGGLGYHSATDPFSVYDYREAHQYYTELMVEAGIDRSFLARVANVPPWDMWFPTVAELERAGILSPGRDN